MRNILFLMLINLYIVIIDCAENNVCANMKDYENILNNPNCWYNSDVDISIPEIIKKYGYPCEIYEVVTQDGYILKLFRIPFGKNGQNIKQIKKQPVFLQHGFASSSAPWIVGSNESIGFLLADQGFDVWIGNSRGTYYSREHIKLSTKDRRYWDFSYHELGIYDIPKSLDFVYKTTGRNDIISIGASVGANVQLVYASELPEHAKNRVKLMIFIGPTIYSQYFRTPLVKFSSTWPVIQEFSRKLNFNEVLSQELTNLMAQLCLQSTISILFCLTGLFSLFGFDFDNLKPELYPLLVKQHVTSGSMKTIVHILQGIESKDFNHFDYGYIQNLKYYNSQIPPVYNLTRVTIPGYIMYGANDWVGTEEGSIRLYKSLPNSVGLFKIPNPKCNHVDLFYATFSKIDVTDHLLKVVNKYRN